MTNALYHSEKVIWNKTKHQKKMEKQGYIYIITNYNNSTLYIGITSNLIKRIWEHKNHVIDGFSNKYNLEKLVYFEQCDSIETAILREKFLKGKTRQYKVSLIQKENPTWKDLYKDIT